ncbi:MAG: NADH-quinone oxidoreductase subunit NuoH [Candidatus Gastranaerophilales bacterium]|nr:NADH-quinone oxidoreductase subunit NuoH [Candidatus Gastranaerophilales bacterium]
MGLFELNFIEYLINFNVPHWLIFILRQIIYFSFAAILMFLAVLFLVLFERKYLAFFTRRKGPNRVGFCGCLQTIADALKILFKENILPDNSDKLMYYIAPIIVFAPVMTVYFLIPYSSDITPFSSSTGIILFCAILSLPVIGVIFAGYSTGNKYSLIGAVRSCIQVISAEIPIFLVLASVVILSNSMNLYDIVVMQNGSLFNWNIFPSLLGFIIFFICSLITLNRIPFDFPEAESELVAGYNCEYSGMKFAMFFLGEYALTFIFSVFTACLFLGGYNPPFGGYLADHFNLSFISGEILKNIEQFFWLIFKTFVLILIIMWIRAAYPRFRTDKALELCWYIFIPLALFNLIVVCCVQYFRELL